MTSDEIDDFVERHRISLRPHPRGEGWIAEGRGGGCLAKGQTQEEARAKAAAKLLEGEIRAEEARKGRLWDILAKGVIYPRPRQREVPDRDGISPDPDVITTWDILSASDDSVLVAGERSLIAAVLAAEPLLLARAQPAAHKGARQR